MESRPHGFLGHGTRLRILLVEDDEADAEFVRRELEREFGGKQRLSTAETLETARDVVARESLDLVILDLSLPDSDGLSTFEAIYPACGPTPVVIYTGNECEETAANAVRSGAQDFLVKGAKGSVNLARSLRFAIERRRRLDAERELLDGRDIQRQLLPTDDPKIDGYDIAGRMYPPKQTAGDYFDYLEAMTNDQQTGLVVGDVSGHGLGPAMVMAETRGCINALARTEDNLAEILNTTNRVLASKHGSFFVSLFLGCLDSASRTVTYASAGHQGYLLHANGDFTKLESTGLVLSVDPDSTYRVAGPIRLVSGEMLVLLTDGWQETRSDQGLLGVTRVMSFIHGHRNLASNEIIGRLFGFVRDYAGGRPQDDDMTMLLVRAL